jgi:mRNA capping enzyme, beta chain
MELMRAFEEPIKKYRDAEHIEIELRLGRIQSGKFETDVGPHRFGQIVRGLEAYLEWESVEEIQDEVYYWGGGISNSSVRCRYSDAGAFTERKNSILKQDLALGMMDVRLSIAQEIPVEMPTEDATRCVTRKRKSFLRKNVRIDLTMVHGPPVDKDSENTLTYQVELEILSAKTDQEIFSALYKVHDVLRLLQVN